MAAKVFGYFFITSLVAPGAVSHHLQHQPTRNAALPAKSKRANGTQEMTLDRGLLLSKQQRGEIVTITSLPVNLQYYLPNKSNSFEIVQQRIISHGLCRIPGYKLYLRKICQICSEYLTCVCFVTSHMYKGS